MELRTANRRIEWVHTRCKEVDERPIDVDILLPDFLPEIAAVLTCSVTPMIQARRVSGDRITADGTALIHVWYLDEERRCVRSFETSQPFSASFTVKDLDSRDTVLLRAKPHYVNCRATGPRRLDIHGAFGVYLAVVGIKEIDVLGDACGDGVYRRLRDVAVSVPCAAADKTFTLNETADLAEEWIADRLVRTEATAMVKECKQLSGKAVLKGEVCVKTVYAIDRSATLATAVHTFPFSQIVDADGLSETCLCDARASVCACDVRLLANPNGEMRSLSVSIKLMLSLRCFTEMHESVVCDAFHTAYPTTLTTVSAELCHVCSLYKEQIETTCELPLPDAAIEQVCDAWCTVSGLTDDTVNMTLSLLTKDAEGMLAYYERPCEVAVDGLSAKEHLDITPIAVTCHRGGDTLNAQIRLDFCGYNVTYTPLTAVADVATDEGAPYPVNPCSVKVCFAEAGEDVWELARRHHASPEALKTENELSEDILSKRMMLLVPIR